MGALIATLLLVGAFVGWRALNRTDLDVKPTAVDYHGAATYAAQNGITPWVPSSLPSGWIATSAQGTGGDRPTWSMGVLTTQGRFIGLRQENASLEELLPTYVGKGARPVAPYVGGQTWAGVADGDQTGYSISRGDETVLVYGSAPAADLQRFISLLVRQ